MYARFSRLTIFLVAFAVIIGGFPAVPSHAEDQPLVAYSMGVLQNDGTVLYSILLASGEQPLTDLTISGTIPAEAVSTVPVIAPDGAVLVTSPAKDTVQWQLKTLEAATVVGPFTYRAVFPADYKNLPASTAATVSWAGSSAGSIKAEQLSGTLTPLAENGNVQLSLAGMIDDQGIAQPISVGDTGIVLYVGDKAVTSPVALHFKRLPITEQTVPQSLADTWWCALVKIESDSPLSLTKPILVGLPTRQVLTPGMPVQLLTRNSESEPWQSLDTAQGMSISAFGNLAFVMLTGKIPTFLAVGVAVKERQKSSLPASVVTNATGFAGVIKVSGSSTGMSFAGRTH